MRHIGRYREIATAFSRNGLGFIVKELGLEQVFALPRRMMVKQRPETSSKSLGARIRNFLEELGPTFIKVGQMASTRPDLLPKHIIDELSLLQDDIAPFSYEEVENIIEKELGHPVHEVFEKFAESPIGAASIGQVHGAVLKNGEKVVVKVQRPNIYKQIHTDLEILEELAKRAEKRFDWAYKYQVVDIIEEFSTAIKDELDYKKEGRNTELIAKQFSEDPEVITPDIYWDYTNRKVLTMEALEGIKLSHQEELKEEAIDLHWLSEKLVHTFMYQIFKEGVFHADPHIGNIMAIPNQGVALLDFGLVGRLSPEMRERLASLVIAMVKQDVDRMLHTITDMEVVSDDVNEHELRADLEQLMIKYYDVPLSEVSLGESITDLFSVAQRHKVRIPSDLTLVGKALITLEGVIEQLNPDFSIVDAAEPFGQELIREKYHPKRIAENVMEQLNDYGEILEDLPATIKELKAMAKQRKLPIEISIPKSETFLSKLDQISNRLSFSIVLLAFSLIMVGLIIGSALGRQTSLLWDVPAIEIGFVIAILMFAWLIYSIFRSGRF